MATVPFSFECNKESGFIMDPNEHKRVGYVTTFKGLGMGQELPKDLVVSLPYDAAQIKYTGLTQVDAPALDSGATGSLAKQVQVVGVIEKWETEGGVGHPIKIEFYVSQENATLLKSLQQQVMKTTTINELGWWIADYDQETKQWYEAAFPASANLTISGLITGKDNPELNVDLSPVAVKDGVDVNVYKVSISVAPAANKAFVLSYANSSTKKVCKSWGLVVGTLAKAAVT